MGAVACPPFEEATRRFQELLSENAWPTEIVWVKTEKPLEYPRDSDEAERLMHPWDGGLKLSVAVKGDVR